MPEVVGSAPAALDELSGLPGHCEACREHEGGGIIAFEREDLGFLKRWFQTTRDVLLSPTRTFETRDPRCAPLDYIRGDARSARPRIAMSNNFAFGGINTSLLFRTV